MAYCRFAGGVTTKRYESQRGGMGGGGGGCGVSANEYSCAHHVTWSPNKIWRSSFIFNVWPIATLKKYTWRKGTTFTYTDEQTTTKGYLFTTVNNNHL